MQLCNPFTTCRHFFNVVLAEMPYSVNTLKRNYCEDDFNSCARYQVKKVLGHDSVPLDLYPHHNDRADKIIKG